jgi:hypothetical protein
MASVFPEAGQLQRVFAMMGVAEDVIAKMPAKYFKASFRIMRPTDGFVNDRTVALNIYGGHCDELATRILNGEDTRPGTDAEVLIGMLVAATVAPLNRDGMLVAVRAAARFPKVADVFTDVRVVERWAGQEAELMNEARRRTAADWRRYE